MARELAAEPCDLGLILLVMYRWRRNRLELADARVGGGQSGGQGCDLGAHSVPTGVGLVETGLELRCALLELARLGSELRDPHLEFLADGLDGRSALLSGR